MVSRPELTKIARFSLLSFCLACSSLEPTPTPVPQPPPIVKPEQPKPGSAPAPYPPPVRPPEAPGKPEPRPIPRQDDKARRIPPIRLSIAEIHAFAANTFEITPNYQGLVEELRKRRLRDLTDAIFHNEIEKEGINYIIGRGCEKLGQRSLGRFRVVVDVADDKCIEELRVIR